MEASEACGEGRHKRLLEEEAAQQLSHLELRSDVSNGSSDKRQRLEGQVSRTAADATSSLLPLQPLTAEAARTMQRLGSPELEEEEEGAVLAAMLAPESADAGSGSDTSADAGAGSGGGVSPSLDQPLTPGSEGAQQVDQPPKDAYMMDAAADDPSYGTQAAASPGSPQAAVAVGAPRAEQQAGRQADPVIRHLADADAAAPIQMVDLQALAKNPAMQQWQAEQAAAKRAEQRARAVAAAVGLRRQQEAEGAGAMFEEEEDPDDVLLPV